MSVPGAGPPTDEDVGYTLDQHPYLRYSARAIDYFASAIFVAIAIGIAAPEVLEGPLGSLIVVMGGVAFWVPFEILFIASAGTTPGKAMCRLRVVQSDTGELPTFGESAKRSALVWVLGMGIGFPLLSLLAMAVGYGSLKRKGRSLWDRKLGLEVRYLGASRRRILLIWLFWVCAIALNSLG